MSDLEKMDIVIVGHVDHGKSTVIGRLLADTNSLPIGKLDQIRAYCERQGMPFEYAFLIDALKDERRQNITIDSARVFFTSERRRYIIIDAPGHIEFVRNMVTGAARAEAALLVIDAEEGIQENSRRHGQLLSLLGVRQVAVLVNKMDLVDYSKARFESIRSEYAQFLKDVGLQATEFIPVSARHGDNICQSSDRMVWFGSNGSVRRTVLQVLDGFEKEKPSTDRPFRLPVQGVYRFTAFGDDRRIVAGTVASGTASVGDELVFHPSGKRSRIERIETWPDGVSNESRRISAGQAVGFTLVEQIYVQRGEVATLANEPALQTSRRLRTSLFWLGRVPLVTRKPYVFKLGTARRRGHVERILRVLDAGSLEGAEASTEVKRNQVAECILALEQSLACDSVDTSTETSRFVIVDDFDIRGGGVILEALPDTEAWVRERMPERAAHWIPSDVTPAQRALAYNQHACLVIITGRKGAGRKSLARALEERLFREGRFVYYLGIGSVVYGVNADIAGQTDQAARTEHVRRMAEVAHILLDAGLILVITAVELTQSDMALFQTSVARPEIAVIWVGDEVNTDIDCDLVVPADADGTERVLQIMAHLQECRICLGRSHASHEPRIGLS